MLSSPGIARYGSATDAIIHRELAFELPRHARRRMIPDTAPV